MMEATVSIAICSTSHSLQGGFSEMTLVEGGDPSSGRDPGGEIGLRGDDKRFNVAEAALNLHEKNAQCGCLGAGL